MTKFCGKCGAKLDMQTGMCPVCQREQILAQQKNSRTRTRANKRHPLRTVVFCILIFIIAVTLAFLALRHKKPIPEELAQTAPSATQPEQRDEIPQRVQAVVTDEYFDNSYVSSGLSSATQKSLTGNTYCYHIPRVNLDAPDIARTNRQIYEDLYYGVMMPYVYSMAEPHLRQMAYTYGEKGDILSILVCAYDLSAETYHDNRQYWFYNISKTTGTLVSDEEVAGAFGISPEEYDSLVKQAVEKIPGSCTWAATQQFPPAGRIQPIGSAWMKPCFRTVSHLTSTKKAAIFALQGLFLLLTETERINSP